MMRFSSGLPLLVVGLCSVALCRDSILVTNGDVDIRFSAPTPIASIAERGIISSIGVSTPCQVVSGLATPVPSGSVCGVNATSVAKAGAGILVEYTSGSPYVASLGACSAQCLATSCCTNIYFIVGSNCNLHYGPKAYAPNAGPSYHYYDASCFTCGGLTCTASTSLSTTTFASISSSSVQSTLSSATSTLSSTPTACGAVALTSPTPSGSICGVQADSVVVSGSGILTEYGSGSPYVASIDACSAQCIATATCTNFYFNVGVNCNLHYGPVSYVLNTNGVNSYSLYEISCFDCYNLALTTTFTPPPACTTAAFTEMGLSGTDLWQNAINPVPSSTVTSCYPSQFYSSALATASGISLPPFSAIVCPYGWETYDYNTTYIICCPR